MKAACVGLTALLALAACGVDGSPTPPPAKSGVSVSGEMKIGVTG